MRVRSVLVTALLAVLVPAGATAAGVHWGLRGGVNASAFTGEFGDAVRPHNRYFPNAGLALQVDLARNVSFRTEAAYSVKGGGVSASSIDVINGAPAKKTWQFDYIEVPVMIRTRMPVGEGAGAAPYLEVGPFVAVALGGKFTSGQFPDFDLRDDMKDVDTGLGGGFGVEVPAGRTRASLEVRYSRGFSDLMKGDGLSIINQAWTLAACWLY